MSLITFKATSKKLPGGLAVENESRGFKLILDEPEDLGGTDTGMNPVEALLCTLGSCETIVASAFAKANDIAFDELWFELEGDLDTDGFLYGKPGVRNGFQEIRVVMHIKTNASAEKVQQFQEFIESRCPVSDMLTHGTRLAHNKAIIERTPVVSLN